ncbi:hypothetical protein KY345_01105 [Candidatus Woesearchaeota archaeon]|nr:hypothetical protein [Candidatus Woesearchaeota archaeon]
MELFFSLIFIIPLFYMIGLKQPILTGFFIISLVDFIIQAYYNLLPRKDGKQVIKLWKNRLISSEREHFHPISLQRYTFKDFTCKILEPGKINPTRNHVMNHRLMELRLLNHILKHQFGNKDSLVFSLDKITLENNARTVKGLNIDKKILSKLKRINKNITNNIITCYMFRKSFLRIVFNKNFALENSQQTYNFLKKVRSKTK